jgi:hypothetical protein
LFLEAVEDLMRIGEDITRPHVVIVDVSKFRRTSRAAEEKHTNRGLSPAIPHISAKFRFGKYTGKVNCGEESGWPLALGELGRVWRGGRLVPGELG